MIDHPAPPSASGEPRPWGWRQLRGELTVPITAARLAVNAPRMGLGRRIKAPVTVLLPGWLASETSMDPLRRFLRLRGVDARHWGLGRNRGRPLADRDQLIKRLVDECGAADAPVALVGWSLGGVIAREVARAEPTLVQQVITYGSPIQGGPKNTIGERNYDPAEVERIEALIAERNASDPIQVPLTVVFSRRDGIVDWRACIDRVSPRATHYEARSAHLGMGIDPDVWRLVLQKLAAGSDSVG